MRKRVEWNGKTSEVAFIFEFVGDDTDAITFKHYLDYEKENPGKLDYLRAHYFENEEAWLTNEAKLTEDQLKTLNVYLDCVNEWFEVDRNFMLGMTQRWRINLLIDEWNPSDPAGLEELRSADDWWRGSDGDGYIGDALDRVGDTLGYDSYLYEKLKSLLMFDDLYGVLFDFYIEAGPYDYETLGFTDDDGEVDIPDEELASINNFLASNSLLIVFHDATKSYRAMHSKVEN